MTDGDDGIRERHGVMCRNNLSGKTVSHVLTWERAAEIVISTECSQGAVLTPDQARYLALKLYRLARRVRQREGVE